MSDASRGPPRVKNKAPAPIQISSEQLLREAVDRQEEKVKPAATRFQDLEELHEYQGRKRREFEDYIRRNRISLKNWTQYAAFELEQKEYKRARSIFERALDALPTNTSLWIKYLESEMRAKNVNHARNLFDRACTLLPRNDKLWYKYVYFEELLGNIAGTRQVFERWMQWEPEESAWMSYISLEKRYQEYDRARGIFDRFVIVHPEPSSWLKWAKFEQEFGDSEHVRQVFDDAIDALGGDFMDEKIFIAYGKYETRLQEYERARAIYKIALDELPRSKSAALHKTYTTFEKQFGDQDGVEDVVLSKRRVRYEEMVKAEPHNYDAWVDYCRLEESGGNPTRVIDVYERAIAQTPPSPEKRHWRRYIYLWIFYAIWAEVDAADIPRARQIYQLCLQTIPHKHHTHAKVWILKAHFEIRQGDLTAARKTLGQAIGRSPKDKLFRAYIELEMKLFEFERCRTLHTKRVEFDASNCQAWIKFAELERGLDEADRARGLFEIAVEQPILDMPELLWKAYIDFEEDEGQYGRTRALYERLLAKTDHVKVWTSYAHFEINAPDDDDDQEEEDEEEERPVSDAAKARARAVFERAHAALREKRLADDRVALLAAWKAFEATHGSQQDRERVEGLMPRRVKKRRRVERADGADAEFEEYLDWVFPGDDEGAAKISKLLAAAQQWKKAAAQ